jgi:hypothetical protein
MESTYPALTVALAEIFRMVTFHVPFAESVRSPDECIVTQNLQEVKVYRTETVMEPTSETLLDRVRDTIRLKRYSIRTEQSYINWAKRYVFFHCVRHPDEMGAAGVGAFLPHLAVSENVAASPDE